ncbi:chain-length determining protein [Rhodobacteraceae bacterium LMO-12]|nr:chain-length determining protein [Rhodobacteraceae bacterium LMO-JJ12]
MGQIQSVGDFLNMMRRRIVLILAVIILGSAFSIWWTLGQPRIYEATAVAQIESPTVADPAASGAVTANPADHRLRILEQKLMARDNLTAMVERYGLYQDTDFSAGLKVAMLRESVRITQITDPNAGWGAQRVPTGMMITVNHGSPETAAAMANDFLEQLVNLNRQRRSSATLQNLEFFKGEAARVEAEMAALEARIAEFKEKNALYLPEGVAAQRAELGTLRTALLDIEQKLIELDASRTRQRAEVIERQSTLLREQQALIQSRINEINGAIDSAPEVERQFGILTRQLDQLKEQFTIITRSATEAEMGQLLTSQDQFERIEVLESALVPENPVSGSRKKKVVLGAFLSGVLGVGLAFVLETLNPVIRTPAQLERQLNVKAVVAIPKLTVPGERRRKRILWLTILAGLLALLWSFAGVVKEAVSGLVNMLSSLQSKA